jgi:hypothetical protein
MGKSKYGSAGQNYLIASKAGRKNKWLFTYDRDCTFVRTSQRLAFLVSCTEVAHRSDSRSGEEVIPFPRITSSINAGFPVLFSELGRQNELAGSKSYVFSHLLFQTLEKPKLKLSSRFQKEYSFNQHYSSVAMS